MWIFCFVVAVVVVLLFFLFCYFFSCGLVALFLSLDVLHYHTTLTLLSIGSIVGRPFLEKANFP